MKKVRIGIIGTGGIARGRHITELMKCEDAEIVAICDIDPTALDAAKEQIGKDNVKCYSSYVDLIGDSEVDAVEVCTPNDLHAEIAIAALEAGKPVNLEKPIAMSYAEAMTILKAEKNSDTFGMTCFTYRFMPAVRYALHLMKDGVLGDILGLNVTYAKNSALWEGRRLEWRFIKSRAASGVTGDLGVHLVDLAQMLAGEITELCAMTDIVVKERTTLDGSATAPVETDDTCLFLARFSCGAMGTFHITRAAIGHANTIRYDVYGTRGSLSFELAKPVPDTVILTVGEGDPKDFTPTVLKVPEEFYLSQAQCFVNAVNGKRDTIFPTLESGAQGQKVIDAIIESSENHSWVKV